MNPFYVAFLSIWSAIAPYSPTPDPAPPQPVTIPTPVYVEPTTTVPTTTTTLAPYQGTDNGTPQTAVEITTPIYVVLYGFCSTVDSHTYSQMVALGDNPPLCSAAQQGEAMP